MSQTVLARQCSEEARQLARTGMRCILRVLQSHPELGKLTRMDGSGGALTLDRKDEREQRLQRIRAILASDPDWPRQGDTFCNTRSEFWTWIPADCVTISTDGDDGKTTYRLSLVLRNEHGRFVSILKEETYYSTLHPDSWAEHPSQRLMMALLTPVLVFFLLLLLSDLTNRTAYVQGVAREVRRLA